MLSYFISILNLCFVNLIVYFFVPKSITVHNLILVRSERTTKWTYSGFFFLIHFLPVLGNLFSDREQLLLVDFFKHLNMKHCIILGNNISSNINLQMVKQFSALKIYTGIQTEREMLVSDISEKSIAPKSVVVYKSVDNVARIKEYFSYLHKNYELSLVSSLTWLTFVNVPEISDLNFIIPYECEFFVVHPSERSTFKIAKTYSLGENSVYKNYGEWTSIGNYKFSMAQRFPVTLNANQTLYRIVDATCNEEFQQWSVTKQYFDVRCMPINLLKDLIRSMNFKYVEKNQLAPDILYKVEGQVDLVPTTHGKHQHRKFVKYWPKVGNHLFMKYPKTEHSLDFYIKPFDINLWLIVTLTIILGGMFCALLKYLHVFGTESRKVFCIVDYVLIPYESICNQGSSAAEYDKKISLRISIFTFGVLALVVFSFYCADLVSYLSLQIVKIPFRNLEEFSQNGKYKLLTRKKFHHWNYIKERNDSVGLRIKQLGLIEYFEDRAEWLKKICSKKRFASIIPTNVPLFANCRLLATPQSVYSIFHVSPFGYQNYFTNFINHKVLHARESGIVQKFESILESFSVKQYIPKDEKEGILQAVEMGQLIQIFTFLGVASVIGLAFFVCEILIKFIIKNLRRKFPLINGA